MQSRKSHEEFDDRFLEKLRISEEIYAQKLSGERVRVTFTAGNFSYTDGSVIIVNPFLDNIYLNTSALAETEHEMHLMPKFSTDRENALRLITRLQIIHESLHVRFSMLPPCTITDENAYSMKAINVLNLINEIIEDSYIENIGCTMGAVMEQYLRFYRLLQKNVYGNKELDDIAENKNSLLWNKYIEYMANYVLFPMKEETPDDLIWDYVERTKNLFLEGATTANYRKRYEYTDRIFDEISELIREMPKAVSGGGSASLDQFLGKSKTHTETELGNRGYKKPQDAITSKTLFENWKQRELPRDYVEMNHIYFDLYKDLDNSRNEVENVNMGTLKCSRLHNGITLSLVRTKDNRNNNDEYQEIYREYHSIIHNYRARFDELLHAKADDRIRKCYLGSGIDSKRIADVKKRYWYRKQIDTEVPELGIIFMVDCSYSMEGARIEAVKRAMVIMNEVLKGKGVDYAIFGHTAIHRQPQVVHNIVFDFNSGQIDKGNILSLEAKDGSREGVSLVWANDYLVRHTPGKNRLIVAISDGEPNHFVSSRFLLEPPESVMDAREVVRKIQKTKTHVVAVALEGGGKPCYMQLKEIYDHVIECFELSRLPLQLLELVSKELL